MKSCRCCKRHFGIGGEYIVTDKGKFCDSHCEDKYLEEYKRLTGKEYKK